jgi:hypothetical protein
MESQPKKKKKDIRVIENSQLGKNQGFKFKNSN